MSLVSAAINKISALTTLPSEEIQWVELSVVEAVVNSIRHSYQNSPDYKVEVQVSIHPNSLVITVVNNGIPMEPDLLEKCKQPLEELSPGKIETIPESGRGLLIIKSVMDNVAYTVENQRNLLVMTKYLPKN